MQRLWWVALLVGCDITLEPEYACEEAAFAASSRVYACTGSSAQANDAYDLVSDFPCKLDGVDREEVGVLDASWYECARAIADVPCEAVTEGMDDPDFWKGQDRCWEVFEGVEPPQFTTPPYTR